MKISLSEIIQEISERVWENQTIENFWVNNKTGLEKSDRRVSDDISNYKIIKHNYFAYNPYRINVWSIGLFDWELWAVSPAYIVFKVDEKRILPSLLLNFLKSQRWLVEINQHTHGWVRKSLSISDLWKIKIDIPEIEKQKEFVDLSIKNSSIIKKIEYINSNNQDLVKKLRQSILQDAIQGKLVPQDPNDEPANELLKKIKTEKEQLIKEKKIKKPKDLVPISDDEIPFDLPKGWERVRLGDIVSILWDGLHWTPNYKDNWEIFFINWNNLNDWKIIIKNSTKTVWLEEYEKYKKELTDRTIFVSINWTLGNVAFYNWEKVILGKSAAYFNLLLNIDKLYIKRILESIFFVDYAIKQSTGSTIMNLWLKALNEFKIPLPPLAEQHRIVAKVDELMKFCDNLEKQISEAKVNGEKLMESVLGEVFR